MGVVRGRVGVEVGARVRARARARPRVRARVRVRVRLGSGPGLGCRLTESAKESVSSGMSRAVVATGDSMSLPAS